MGVISSGVCARACVRTCVCVCDTPSIAFRHLSPRKDVVNQCLECVCACVCVHVCVRAWCVCVCVCVFADVSGEAVTVAGTEIPAGDGARGW